MEKKRTLMLNIAVIAAVLLLALGALGLSRVLPQPDITPTTEKPEDLGISFTMEGLGN